MIQASQVSDRTVMAPMPSTASANLPANRVLSVTLSENEDVEWLWTTTADGTSYVSGYRILVLPTPTQSSNEQVSASP